MLMAHHEIRLTHGTSDEEPMTIQEMMEEIKAGRSPTRVAKHELVDKCFEVLTHDDLKQHIHWMLDLMIDAEEAFNHAGIRRAIEMIDEPRGVQSRPPGAH